MRLTKLTFSMLSVFAFSLVTLVRGAAAAEASSNDSEYVLVNSDVMEAIHSSATIQEDTSKLPPDTTGGGY